jgi:heptosyltransferase-2
MENSPAKVLIFDTAWLGDVIFTTSLIGSVRQIWPDTELHVLVAKRAEMLVRHHPLIDRVWVYDKNGSEKSFGRLLKLTGQLRAESYDIVLNAHPSFRSRLISYLSGARVRVGYYGFGSSLAFTHRVRNSLDIQPDHAARRVDLLRALEPTAASAPLRVGLMEESQRLAKAFIGKLDADRAPLLALIPGSARFTKMWPSEGFIDVAKRWIHETGGHVLAIGGESERGIIEQICENSGAQCHPVVNMPLDDAAALLAECKCAVGNDTGVSFLAIAAGCPQVLVLYGCTQVNYSFPLPHKAIAAGVPCCLPPTGHGRSKCKWGEAPWCMRQISPERVWREIDLPDKE